MSILALSGGGSNGAFGAGAIAGLNHDYAQAPYSVVTGVSAGALIAPLAFLGPGWNSRLTEIYTSGATGGLLRPRPFAALFGSSMYSNRPLRRLISHYANDELIDAVAAEAAKGRLLFVSTTDVATSEPVIWDLTSIALRGDPDSKRLFRQILLASASVPGFLPPVSIRITDGGKVHDELHVDGAVTMPFFVVPAPWELSRANLGETSPMTRVNAISIFSRSVSAALSRMTQDALHWVFVSTREQRIDVQYAAIPVSYPLSEALEFRAEAQRSLFQYGFACAEAGRLWASAGVQTQMEQRQTGVTTAATCPADDVYIARFTAGN
jgi:hypothetical protein